MPFPKKLVPFATCLSIACLFWAFLHIHRGTPPPELPPLKNAWSNNALSHGHTDHHKDKKPQQPFRAGIPKPVGETYTKMLVIPRTKDENVDWINDHFGQDPNIQTTIYTVDDPDSEPRPPRNKGHEVMVYISYIIDHYDDLSDITIFMHSHQLSWHNNYLLDNDAAQMIGRLSSERVYREGYMNMRCHWGPGCPDWMHPGTAEEDMNKQEETMLARSWSELFPLDPIPSVLAQPCCGQFAVSRERIQTLPLAKYVFYRDWLLRTKLSDYISGRVWEYVWHFVFSGQNVVCPKEHVCYCDGFGVCFGGEDEYEEWFKKDEECKTLEHELEEWNSKADNYIRLGAEVGMDEAHEFGQPEPGKDEELRMKIKVYKEECQKALQKAKERGDVAKYRADEVGRPWKDGDGF